MHTRRNTHSSGSTCHIPLSPDNIAAVKVAASVIGRTNHSRRDEMVLSCRSESQEELRQRTSCQTAAMKKREVTQLLQLPSMSLSQSHFAVYSYWAFLYLLEHASRFSSVFWWCSSAVCIFTWFIMGGFSDMCANTKVIHWVITV